MLDTAMAHIEGQAFVRSFGTLFAVASPIGAIPFFLGFTAGQTGPQRRRSASMALLTMAAALATTIAFGTAFMRVFGITEDGFRVGGGFVILLSGIGLVRGKIPSIAVALPNAEGAETSKLSVISPFAIPLVVGPGAISAVIIGLHADPGLGGYLVVSSACVTLLLLMYVALLLADLIYRLLGELAMNVMVRLMGLVIVIIAFETILTGLKAVLPGLG